MGRFIAEWGDAPKEPEPIFLPNLYFPPTRRSRRCEEESAIDIQIRG